MKYRKKYGSGQSIMYIGSRISRGQSIEYKSAYEKADLAYESDLKSKKIKLLLQYKNTLYGQILIGDFYLNCSMYFEALKHYKLILETDSLPNALIHRINLKKSIAINGIKKEIEKQNEQVIKIHKDLDLSYFNKISGLLHHQLNDEKINLIKNLFKEYPSLESYINKSNGNNNFYYNLGKIYAFCDQEKAIEFYIKSKIADNELLQFIIDDSEVIINKLSKLNDPYVNDLLGFYYHSNDSYELAVKFYRKGVDPYKNLYAIKDKCFIANIYMLLSFLEKSYKELILKSLCDFKLLNRDIINSELYKIPDVSLKTINRLKLILNKCIDLNYKIVRNEYFGVGELLNCEAGYCQIRFDVDKNIVYSKIHFIDEINKDINAFNTL